MNKCPSCKKAIEKVGSVEVSREYMRSSYGVEKLKLIGIKPPIILVAIAIIGSLIPEKYSIVILWLIMLVGISAVIYFIYGPRNLYECKSCNKFYVGTELLNYDSKKYVQR